MAPQTGRAPAKEGATAMLTLDSTADAARARVASVLALGALFVLLLPSCAGGARGTPLARVEVDSVAAVAAVTDTQVYGIVAQGAGHVYVTPAREPWLPIYGFSFPPEGVVALGFFREEDGPSWRGAPGDPVPAELAVVARRLWTDEQIGRLGLVFDGPSAADPAPAP